MTKATQLIIGIAVLLIGCLAIGLVGSLAGDDSAEQTATAEAKSTNVAVALTGTAAATNDELTCRPSDLSENADSTEQVIARGAKYDLLRAQVMLDSTDLTDLPNKSDGKGYLVVLIKISAGDKGVDLDSDDIRLIADDTNIKESDEYVDDVSRAIGVDKIGDILGTTLDANEQRIFVSAYELPIRSRSCWIQVNGGQPERISIAPVILTDRRLAQLLPTPTATPTETQTPRPTSMPTYGPTATPTTDPHFRLSGAGGIGNTREDVYGYWGISPDTEPLVQFTVFNKQDVTYNSPGGIYQLSFIFQLQKDDKLRDTDRLMQLVIDFSPYPMTEADALDFASEFLPRDIILELPRHLNRFGDATWEYSSDLVYSTFPHLEVEGEIVPNPGTVYLILYQINGQIEWIEIALFDTTVY